MGFGTTGSVDQILGSSTPGGSQLSPIPNYPATPPSETILTAPDRPYSGGAKVCLSHGDIMRRITYATYQGPLTTASQFPFVASDACPVNRYRVLFGAALLMAKMAAAGAVRPALYMVPQGSKLPTRTDGTDPFFLGYFTNANNYGPPAQGIRMDSWGTGDTSQIQNGSTQLGISLNMIPFGDGPILIPPGWSLLGYDESGIQTALVAGAQMEMRISYAELDLTEDFQF